MPNFGETVGITLVGGSMGIIALAGSVGTCGPSQIIAPPLALTAAIGSLVCKIIKEMTANNKPNPHANQPNHANHAKLVNPHWKAHGRADKVGTVFSAVAIGLSLSTIPLFGFLAGSGGIVLYCEKRFSSI